MPKLDPVKAFWWAFYNDMNVLEQLITIEKMVHIFRQNWEIGSTDAKQHQTPASGA